MGNASVLTPLDVVTSATGGVETADGRVVQLLEVEGGRDPMRVGGEGIVLGKDEVLEM